MVEDLQVRPEMTGLWREPPTTLVVVAWLSLVVGGLVALAILYDVYGRGRRQKMGVMEAVWPVTALYTGPVGWWLYARFGRPQSPAWQEEQQAEAPEKPQWAVTTTGVLHCGAGCTLGDIIAETAIFLLGITLVGEALYAEFIGDYVLAVLLGLLFQYYAIAPMRGLGLREGLVAAVKADIASLTAFEVGLFGWMALQAFVLFPDPHRLHPDSPVYWFGMQIGMCLGFFTAYPVNAWLIRSGVKEAM